MLRPMRWFLLPFALTALPRTALPQGTMRLTGVFGDLHYMEEAGDVIGTEIIVSRTASGYRVTFQDAEGEPGPVDTVPATIRGDSLFFELPPDTVRRRQANGTVSITLRPRSFRGRIMATRLHGHISSWGRDLDLPRRAKSARLP